MSNNTQGKSNSAYFSKLMARSRSNSFASTSDKITRTISKSSTFSSKSKYSINSSFISKSKSFSKKFNPFFKNLNSENLLGDSSVLDAENCEFEYDESDVGNIEFDYGSPNTINYKLADFFISPNLSNVSLDSSLEDGVSLLNLLDKHDGGFGFLFENTKTDIIISESEEPVSVHTSQGNESAKSKFHFSSVEQIPRTKINSYISQLSASGILLTKVSRKKKIKYTFKLVGNQLLNWKDKYVDLNQIKDIRVFEEAANYREQFNISKELGGNWITIIYQVPTNKLKALHCYSSSNNEILKFYISILYLVKQKQKVVEHLALPDIDTFVDYHWKDSTVKGLQLSDVKKLCDNFNILCSGKYLKTLFQKSDLNNDNRLDYLEFQTFVKILKQRPDIEELYGEHKSKDSQAMTINEFRNFLFLCQGIEDEEEQNEILSTFDICSGVTLLEFINFLEKDTYLRSSDQIDGYYDHPLNQYFISSSHNTYLRGSQIGDFATIESYIEVLQKGCRCVEVDVWDGENGPVVSHGVLSSSISLKSVLEVIRKYAFITSSFPLIISFEVHCKPEYQFVMIYLIKEYFQGFLCQKFENGKIPTPNELKGKVILKFTKRGKYYEDGEATDNLLENSDCSSDDELIKKSKQDISLPVNSKFNIAGKYKKKVDILPELLQLAAVQGIKYRHFQLPESKKPEHSFSLSEKQLNEMKEDSVTRLFIDKHNRSFFMRTYPHFLRYKSSNFSNLLDFWELGVQMVATNWQTNDLGQCLNIAMFKQPMSKDGTTQWNSGYVLKPEFMLPKVKRKNMNSFYKNLDNSLPEICYKLDLISAHLLSRPEPWSTSNNMYSSDISIFLEYEIFTIKKNEALIGRSLTLKNGFKITSTKGQTKYVKDNGINPMWNSALEFKTQYPEFTFLCLKVKTTGGFILGESYTKLYDVKPGYRHIPLSNYMTGDQFVFSKLFLKVSFL